jgi:Co/Zn/Cd efflux system component
MGSQTVLLVAMFSFSAFAVAELVGASISHSESLMADAATMVGGVCVREREAAGVTAS